jgi:hypothetical protein
MKPKIRTVNPKAGTLKLKNEAVWNIAKNVSKNLIAFILMLGLTLTNMAFVQEDDSLGKGSTTLGDATATTINKADTCCITEKGKTAVIDRKNVKLLLPSSEMIRKADSEVYVNLYASLKEHKNLYFTELMLNKADNENVWNFKSETSGKVSMPAMNAVSDADETVNASFIAENKGIVVVTGKSVAAADEDINSRFIAENEGIKMPLQSLTVAADQEISNNFKIESDFRISAPSAERYKVADIEISENLFQDIKSKGVAKTVKGRK